MKSGKGGSVLFHKIRVVSAAEGTERRADKKVIFGKIVGGGTFFTLQRKRQHRREVAVQVVRLGDGQHPLAHKALSAHKAVGRKHAVGDYAAAAQVCIGKLGAVSHAVKQNGALSCLYHACHVGQAENFFNNIHEILSFSSCKVWVDVL